MSESATSRQDPSPSELDALLRLLDDDNPQVVAKVVDRLGKFGGDISELIASRPQRLSKKQMALLTDILHRSRRENLLREWQVPSTGIVGLGEDWEAFESLLRTISDFLHDGITCRQALSDALDLLAEEAQSAGVENTDQLRTFLFEGNLLKGNWHDQHDPRNSDLAWCVAEGRSNPIGLGVIFILVARRLELVVEPVAFPRHFLCRIHEDGRPIIVDCYRRGQTQDQDALLESPDLTRAERQALKRTADPGIILLRILNNLHHALGARGRHEDAELIDSLRSSLIC